VKDVKFPHEQEPSLVFSLTSSSVAKFKRSPSTEVCVTSYTLGQILEEKKRSLGSAQTCRTMLEVIPHPVSWMDVKNKFRE